MKKSRRNSRSTGRFHHGKPRPHFEKLEDRWLLSAVGFNSLSDVTLPAGTTMFIPLNSTDSGQTVNYAVTASDYSMLTPNITPQTNRTLQLNVLINGVSQPMDFQLFDNLAPATTAQIEQLVQSGFYNGLQIYRNGMDGSGNPFVIQGGNEPPSGLINPNEPASIAEEFNPDLQYTTTGILAMARTGVPGSTSTEFFVTEEAARFLDFNYTMFGLQTTGTSVVQAISAMADENSTQDPNGAGYLVNPVTISSASIFTDTQNGVLELRAPTGVTGTVTVTVVASDGTNTPTTQSFTVTIQPDDTSNPANPFASVIPAAPTSVTYLPPSGASSQLTDLNNSGSGKALQFQVSGVTSGNLVEVLADGNVIGQATANGTAVVVTTDGTTKLTDGSHTFTAIQIAPNQTVTVDESDSSNTTTGTTAEPATADVPSLDCSAAVSLTVDATPPQFSSAPVTAAVVGTPYTYQVATSADASGAVTYQLAQSPTGMTINSTTGLVSWTPQASQMPSVQVDVRATDAAGNTSDQQYTIAIQPNSDTPVVIAISPSQGPATGGTQVTITGAGFLSATAVNFGTIPATDVTVNSDGTQITATSPAGAGVVDVTVVKTGGTSATSSADQFSYTPVLVGISPTQGPAAGGTQVTIAGTNLSGATAVKFGGNTAAIQSNTGTQIVVLAPAGTAGTVVDVTVTTAGGTSATLAADQFAYLAVPAVTGVNPSSQPVAGGTQVTISGTSLAGATAVKFGNTAATINSNTDTQLVVTLPAGTAGTVNVTVVTAGGTSAIVPVDQFTYYVSGTCAVGLYNPSNSVFYLRNCDAPGYANNTFVYGASNDGLIPIVGDWDGNGTETIGLYNPSTATFFLSNSNAGQMADTTFVYGPANSGDIPIVGDWDANGTDTVGLYDPKTSTFYLRNSNTSGMADVTFVYGAANAGLIPLAGDWYGGGKDTIALYNPTTSTFFLRNSNTSGMANVTFMYGAPNSHWTPVVGDWNGDGADSIGLYNPTTSVFYLRNTNEGGYANVVFMYGTPNSGSVPITGDWMGDAKSLMAAEPVVAAASAPTLTQAQLAPIVQQALAQWGSAGLSAADVEKLRQVQFVVTDLPGAQLGEEAGNVIYLDANAAGEGWFVDPTPAQNEEFSASAGSQQLHAIDPRALDRIDLLTVVEHELGHVLGLNDLSALADDVMDGVLGVGVRRLASHVDAALVS